ncbi:MAG TPA: murein L,D-transpeptidase catalytic domain family protein [Novosphingobium sp.]|nr:murein L,D-transpeptidase catalytic domain family protein [Novosphingobium sp.]HMP56605.1 murein L,D-transpeptidase catalytic domain family protein [Novosphingobium sp.]
MNRRDLLAGGLAAGAALALPARAATDENGSQLIPAFDTDAWGPSQPSATSRSYATRILEVARREVSRVGETLWRRDIVGVADFAQPSSRPRLHFANLENGTVRSFLVAHGRGSDREHDGWLKHFSNVPGSEATSRGAYLTAEWYTGKYGTSIRLVGLDPDNHTALERAIVMHPAWYAAPEMIGKWGKLGRSEGCFAMAPGDFNEALWHLSGGRLLFADRIGEG